MRFTAKLSGKTDLGQLALDLEMERRNVPSLDPTLDHSCQLAQQIGFELCQLASGGSDITREHACHFSHLFYADGMQHRLDELKLQVMVLKQKTGGYRFARARFLKAFIVYLDLSTGAALEGVEINIESFPEVTVSYGVVEIELSVPAFVGFRLSADEVVETALGLKMLYPWEDDKNLIRMVENMLKMEQFTGSKKSSPAEQLKIADQLLAGGSFYTKPKKEARHEYTRIPSHL